ncbi:MAG: hypothetical protein V7641_1841 [Blastocatellia bacterium]
MKKGSKPTADLKIPANLELVDDGVRLVSLTFGLSLYTDVLFSSVPDAVLGCFEKFLGLCPADQLKFYVTENMDQHKPVTNRTMGMLKTWLKPGAPPREYIALELKDGDDFYWAPKCKFEVWGNEDGSSGYETQDANLVSMAFPPQWGLERADEMLEFVRDLCAIFPFRSGHAGFCFECSSYEEEQSQTFAWKRSMRHRGIDIFDVANDTVAVGHDGVKGVNWLTILSDPFVKRLGGQKQMRESLSEEIEILPSSGGVIIKCGPQPRFGDTNRRDFLPDYKEVYALASPLIEVAIKRYPSLTLEGDDYEAKTIAWLRRFEL